MRIAAAAGLTDTGRKRRRNEDAFVCRAPLFAVADGMGGAQAGEVASRLAAAAVSERAPDSSGEAVVAALVAEANRRVWQRSTEDMSHSGMGTTITVALADLAAGTIAIGHVGDSRAYRIRDGALEQLTEDHSLVAELVRRGRLSPEEAEAHPQRSVITRALGTEPDVEVDAFTLEALPGDLFLLCSDGLTTMVPDAEILSFAAGARADLDALARALVDAANAAGGEDNVTVVAFELEEGDAPAEEPAAADLELAAAPEEQTAEMRRHGAMPGGRLGAFAAIAGTGLAALLLVWGLKR